MNKIVFRSIKQFAKVVGCSLKVAQETMNRQRENHPELMDGQYITFHNIHKARRAAERISKIPRRKRNGQTNPER